MFPRPVFLRPLTYLSSQGSPLRPLVSHHPFGSFHVFRCALWMQVSGGRQSSSLMHFRSNPRRCFSGIGLSLWQCWVKELQYRDLKSIYNNLTSCPDLTLILLGFKYIIFKYIIFITNIRATAMTTLFAYIPR